MMENFDDIVKEHNEVVRIERLTHHIARIREGMDEMKSAMKEMAQAMTRLALVEERQSNTMASMERMSNALDSIEHRLSLLEASQPANQKTTLWVDKIILAGFMAAMTFIAMKAGLI